MEILGWIVFGILALIILAFFGKKVYNFVRLPQNEREQVLMRWLQGLIVQAELLYTEHGMGKEKFAYVENMFKSKAPIAYKIFLKISGGNLEDLIEKALAEVKKGFEKE